MNERTTDHDPASPASPTPETERPALPDCGRGAMLIDATGRVAAVDPESTGTLGVGVGDALPAATAVAIARIAARLRPGRPPHLERLRLPGHFAPLTFACSLVVADRVRLVRLALLNPGAASARIAAPRTPVEPATDTPAVVRAGIDTAERTEAARELPLRFVWRAGLDGGLVLLDPALAAYLDLSGGAAKNWAALGAGTAHEAVLAGRSFAGLPTRIAGLDADLVLELGGAPVRGEGMRGFGLLRAILPRAEVPALEVPTAVVPMANVPDQPVPTAELPDEAPPMANAGSPAQPVPPPAGTDAGEVPGEAKATDTAGTPDIMVEPEAIAEPPPAPPTAVADVVTPEIAENPLPPAPPARPPLSLVPAAANVVPLRSPPGSDAVRPETARASWAGLTASERNAFREIARALGARLEGMEPEPGEPEAAEPAPTAAAPDTSSPAVSEPIAQSPATVAPPITEAPLHSGAGVDAVAPSPADRPSPTPAPGTEAFRRVLADGETPILDRMPLGIVVCRGEELLYANRSLLDWTGHRDTEALRAAGGLSGLFGSGAPEDEAADAARALAIHTAAGETIPVEARLMSAPWEGGTALLYILRRTGAGMDERVRQAELALREAEATARELRAILDTATDGVVLIDAEGVILSVNRPAEALFGFETGELQGESFTLLFAPESHRAAVDYLDGLASNGVASVLNDGREVIGRVREGGLIPLFMTVGRIGEDAGKFCAVLRDITQWKRAEEELIEAKRMAERASLAKSEFLAKISHEIRTPLNAVIGFSEVMMEERFGPIENERYRDYLRDIHASGGHLISLINDLLDLSKIEAGKLDLAFTSVALNEVVQQCIGIMQPQANRERIIIRSSLAADLPPVVADTRSIRQIVLNLVSNSVKFTPPGGQVILSTALTDGGEVVLRVRDTGIGMSESDIATAMEPFRQLATSGRAGSGGTGLGLPLTKALAEANRASFSIRSAVDAGTLVEITFPSTRVLAE